MAVNGIIGIKLGMTQVFADDGTSVPCTVLQAGPCVVVQRRTKQKDGYEAVQLGLVEFVKPQRVNKPMTGHFKKADVAPMRVLREFRLEESADETKVGDRVLVDGFAPGEFVDVTGVSKGKGFQGGVKRWHFRGGDETHGSMFHRAPGGIGASSFPSRVWKGQHFPGHMGHERVTVKNLRVVKVDSDENLLLVRGAVPGPQGGYLLIPQEYARQIKRRAQRTQTIMAVVDVKKSGRPDGRPGGTGRRRVRRRRQSAPAARSNALVSRSQRAGTHKTKGRGEVSGAGRKLWRQKGTGRARVGSIRSSIWRKGGTVHGPQPRSYAYALPKKMILGALRSALSAKLAEQKLTVVEGWPLETHKTGKFRQTLTRLEGETRTILLVEPEGNRNLELASRNLEGVKLVTPTPAASLRFAEARPVDAVEGHGAAFGPIAGREQRSPGAEGCRKRRPRQRVSQSRRRNPSRPPNRRLRRRR